MWIKKHGKKSDLLKKQPVKSRGKWIPRLVAGSKLGIKSLPYMPFLLVISLLSYEVYNQHHRKLSAARIGISIYRDAKSMEMSAKAKATILETIKLGLSKNLSLNEIARAAQKNAEVEILHIVRVGFNHFTIKAYPRIPVLSLTNEKGQKYYISNSHYIYPQTDEPKHLVPELHAAVFPKLSATGFNYHDADISDESKDIFDDAIELVRIAEKESMTLVMLRHEPYRGFFTKTAQSDAEIAIGQRPFEKKIEKLKKILSLPQEDMSAIELDYLGKALIRKKL